MRASRSIFTATTLLTAAIPASCQSSPSDITTCIDKPNANATASNYPGAPASCNSSNYPYNVTSLADVPVAASACTSQDPDTALACARIYIDAIDEQLGFLYARRLGYAAVAGAAKFTNGSALNDPTRNQAVAAGMAARVVKYGGSEDAGTIMGGEGCQIYVSLEYEAQQIRNCGGTLNETFERICS